MATKHCLRRPLSLAEKTRPVVKPRSSHLSRNLLRTSVRCKSGPYGYTQAKALVYSRHGEPSD
ncbi:hypothetical protein E4U54_004673, partial [Claviceps lovelessii]